MSIISVQEKQSKLKAGFATMLIHGALFLLLYFWIIKTPLPAFPAEPEGTELSLDFGNNIEGMGSTENDNMGDANPSKQVTAKTEPKKNEESNDAVITDETETAVSIAKKEKKNKKVKKETQVDPIKEDPKPSSELESALNVFRNKKNGSGGDGNSDHAGNKGDPNGNPDGDGTVPGNGKFKANLKGRRVAQQPDIIDDSQEEGKVVVEIIVDETGKVIMADAKARGSTNTSAILQAKARQAALSTKFTPSAEGIKEQRGTITFEFLLN